MTLTKTTMDQSERLSILYGLSRKIVQFQSSQSVTVRIIYPFPRPTLRIDAMVICTYNRLLLNINERYIN